MTLRLRSGQALRLHFMRIALGLSLVAAPVMALEQQFLPSTFDMVLLAGSDYLLTVSMIDSQGGSVDITTSEFSSQFRSAPAPAGTIFANFSTSVRIPTFTRYSSSGEALVTTSAAVVDIKLSNAQTRRLSGKSGLWDLRRVNSLNGLISYILTGKVSVRPTVTQ